MERIFSLCCWMTGSREFALETVQAAAQCANPMEYAVKACMQRCPVDSRETATSSLLAGLRALPQEEAMALLLLDRLHLSLAEAAGLMKAPCHRLRLLHYRARMMLAGKVV